MNAQEAARVIALPAREDGIPIVHHHWPVPILFQRQRPPCKTALPVLQLIFIPHRLLHWRVRRQRALAVANVLMQTEPVFQKGPRHGYLALVPL